MSTKKQFVGVRCDISKLDFLCSSLGLNRSQIINNLIDAEYFNLVDDEKKQQIIAQMKDLQFQLEKLKKSFDD